MKTTCKFLAVALLACLFVAGVHASPLSLSVYKHEFASNETIPVVVSNMADGVDFSQKTTFHQFIQPGSPSYFGNNNVTWPFAHEDDSFNMTNFNTTVNSVYIGHWWPPARGGGYEDVYFNGTSSDVFGLDGSVVRATWNRTFAYEYDQTGTYFSRWLATPAPGASIVTSIFWINGTKLSGPVDFTQNTSIWSYNPMLVEVDFYEDDRHAAHDWFTIDAMKPDGSPLPTYAPGYSDDSDSYPGIVVPTTTRGEGPGTPPGEDGSGAGTTPTTPLGTATPGSTPVENENVTRTTGGDSGTSPTPAAPFPLLALVGIGLAGLAVLGRR
ncbi:MAG: hypothetical protein GXY82_04540 [Methanospirillum sp.]|nr:hypothetical protein [Methanospirillum sp.]